MFLYVYVNRNLTINKVMSCTTRIRIYIVNYLPLTIAFIKCCLQLQQICIVLPFLQCYLQRTNQSNMWSSFRCRHSDVAPSLHIFVRRRRGPSTCVATKDASTCTGRLGVTLAGQCARSNLCSDGH